MLVLIALVVLCAAWIVVHVALVVRVMGVTGITTRERLFSLVPLVTPYLAWKSGLRRHVVLWACLIALYGALRAWLALR